MHDYKPHAYTRNSMSTYHERYPQLSVSRRPLLYSLHEEPNLNLSTIKGKDSSKEYQTQTVGGLVESNQPSFVL